MPTKSATERRLALRALLERPQVTHPISVWDGASARIAASMGFELGLLGGSVASHVVLGAPDVVVLTLTEFVEQAHRVTRASDLPLLVDADHGYGNALNVRRTVEELETVGVAALTIEDTVLPRQYGHRDGELISREEFRDKLGSAIASRSDKSLVIVGRTGALVRDGIDETVERVRIAAKTGVDAVFVTGVSSKEQVEALHSATTLPLVLNAAPAPIEELVALGVRLVLQGHLPYFVALKAIADAYQHYRDGGTPAALRERIASPELQAIALAEADYAQWAKDYLAIDR